MSLIWELPSGSVFLSEPQDSRSTLKITLSDETVFSPRTMCDTSYPPDLIKQILDVKGVEWLCDEIARDEDPVYVQKYLSNELTAYFGSETFTGKRILDFGCGCGASTMWLARQFPQSKVIGVELVDDLLSVAKARLKHYGYKNVEFFQSPNRDELPRNIGRFDLVILSAVYEHLLPDERQVVLKQLWSSVVENGSLFLNQTPNLAFPLELHTTMLPLINYAPDRLALWAARRFSRRIDPFESWQELLRKGIRGSTVSEITGILNDSSSDVILLEPSRNGFQDRVDLWFSTTNSSNLFTLKKISKIVLKGLYKLTALALVPDLALAYNKTSPSAK